MNNNELKKGDGLIDPGQIIEKKEPVKKITTKQDGLMEREEQKIVTEDGRELLKEN
jgi:hypothetical protein